MQMQLPLDHSQRNRQQRAIKEELENHFGLFKMFQPCRCSFPLPLLKPEGQFGYSFETCMFALIQYLHDKLVIGLILRFLDKCINIYIQTGARKFHLALGQQLPFFKNQGNYINIPCFVSYVLISYCQVKKEKKFKGKTKRKIIRFLQNALLIQTLIKFARNLKTTTYCKLNFELVLRLKKPAEFLKGAFSFVLLLDLYLKDITEMLHPFHADNKINLLRRCDRKRKGLVWRMGIPLKAITKNCKEHQFQA